jgi:hypothetical protein
VSPAAPRPLRVAVVPAIVGALSATVVQLANVYATFARLDPLLLLEQGTTPLQVTLMMVGPCAALGAASGLSLLPFRRMRWYWAMPAGVAISYLIAAAVGAAGLRLAATI